MEGRIKNKGSVLILAVLFILFLLVGGVLFWQYNLYKKFNALGNGESCAGDWSYAKVCERGSYCKTIKNAPLYGGLCTPYLNWFFSRFANDAHTWENCKKNPKSTISLTFPEICHHPNGWSVTDAQLID